VICTLKIVDDKIYLFILSFWNKVVVSHCVLLNVESKARSPICAKRAHRKLRSIEILVDYELTTHFMCTCLLVCVFVCIYSCDGAVVCILVDPWSCHALGGRVSGTHLPPGPQVPAAAGHQEETCQVLAARGNAALIAGPDDLGSSKKSQL